MKLFTKTFGCQMNFADSDEMSRAFFRFGFQTTEDPAAADAYLINTCTVRELAEHKAMSFIGRLREWKAGKRGRMIVVTGCAAERAKDFVHQRFSHVDLVVGAIDIAAFPQRLGSFLKERGVLDPAWEETAEENLTPANLSLPGVTPAVQAVTITRGCNYSCTYCIVPAVRGREIYRPVETILTESRARVAAGARELWLLGQTVNSYRPADRPGYEFADLLREVAEIPGLDRLRFMSPHPHYLNARLITAMAELPQVCEHIHLPVQSGSNDVLRRMRRNYTRESYLDGLHELRAAMPDIAVTTDIIAGFPGETDADHRATVALVEEANFDSAYCFKYSPRPGTVAAGTPDDVPPEVKEARVNELLAITEEQGRRKASALVDTVQEVLLEEDKGDGALRGKTRGAWRLRLHKPDLRIGQLIRAKVVGSHSRELHGEWVP